MKKINALILALLLFLVNSNVVYAVCDASETNTLNSLAANVRASYEVMREELEGEYSAPDGLTEEELEEYVAYYSFFRIYISNLTEDLYITVENDVDDQVQTYTYQDSDNGTISLDWTNILAITNFTITVYSSSNTNCANTELYTLYLTTPMYNEYSQYRLCDGNEDFYLCNTFLSVPSVDFGRFVELIERYNAGQIDDSGEEVEEPIDSEEEGFFDFIQDNLAIVIGVGVAIVVIGGLTVYVIIRKRRSKVE